MPRSKTTKSDNSEVRSDSAYRSDDFKRRAGLGDWAFREARKNGLKTTLVGKVTFVIGSDWIDFLRDRHAS